MSRPVMFEARKRLGTDVRALPGLELLRMIVSPFGRRSNLRSEVDKRCRSGH